MADAPSVKGGVVRPPDPDVVSGCEDSVTVKDGPLEFDANIEDVSVTGTRLFALKPPAAEIIEFS